MTLEHLLQAVEAHPEDAAARLVYADALEEAGHAQQAEYLRFELDWAARQPPVWAIELAAVNQQRRIEAVRTIREVTLWALTEGKHAFERRIEGQTVDLVEVQRFGAVGAAMERARVLSPGTELSFRTADPSQRLATSLLALASSLSAEWLRRVGRLWALAALGEVSEATTAAADERFGKLTLCEARVLAPGLLRDGLRVDEARQAAAALGEVQVVRSEAFFAWPVRDVPAWRAHPTSG